ncbi:hypothetical protein HHX47_DHR10000429 [Lentinula edodes]|nr:hypothetical protein HHX47_DHR10000429 [Lentinula edodes]
MVMVALEQTGLDNTFSFSTINATQRNTTGSGNPVSIVFGKNAGSITPNSTLPLITWHGIASSPITSGLWRRNLDRHRTHPRFLPLLSPFRKATRVTPSTSVALDVVRRGTPLQTIRVNMAPSSGPGGSKGVNLSSSVSLREKINASAISGTSEGIAKLTRAVRMRMSAPSAEAMGTMPSRTRVAPDLIEAFLELSIPPTLSYYDFSDAIHFRSPLPNTCPEFIELYERIVTPYNADEFEKALLACNISHHYPLLLHNLRRGFPLGHLPPLHETIIIPNHQSVYEHSEVIEQYISDEIAAGRMAGPFSCADMHLIMRGHFYVSPLIVATQIQGPGMPPKHRVCRNLSKDGRDSKGHIVPSVNSFTQKNLFPTRFDTASKVAEMVATAPPGTQACTLDIQKFHRTCPLLPEHKPYLVVQDHLGRFFVDLVFCFGAAPASSNSGMISNAVVDILLIKLIDALLKYEDDLKAFRIPNSQGSYDYDRASMLEAIESLGVPWHPDKGDENFVTVTRFIGFLWNLELKRVSLPDDKRIKYLERIRVFLSNFSNTRVPVSEVESIHGTLCHIAFIYHEGRSHLPPISNFMASYRSSFEENHGRFPPKSVLTELRWWHRQLQDPSYYRELRPRGQLKDFGIFVDASTDWGIGIVFNGSWAAFRLCPNWKIPGRDICWLETVAVELLIYFLESKNFHDIYLLIHSDNQGTIGAFDKARSPNYWINMSIRRICGVIGPLFIQPELKYIPTALNPADPFSRGELGSVTDKLPLTFSLPLELQDILDYV